MKERRKCHIWKREAQEIIDGGKVSLKPFFVL